MDWIWIALIGLVAVMVVVGLIAYVVFKRPAAASGPPALPTGQVLQTSYLYQQPVVDKGSAQKLPQDTRIILEGDSKSVNGVEWIKIQVVATKKKGWVNKQSIKIH